MKKRVGTTGFILFAGVYFELIKQFFGDSITD